ncbi:MAG: HEPN domain-containing protein [Chloroflexota bacterium]
MITTATLKRLAEERLEDAKSLVEAGRYDTAFYMAGYVIEISLKMRICLTLNWNGFPETNNEFQNYRSFRIHDLGILLTLTGMEDHILSTYYRQWSSISSWEPNTRYEVTLARGKAETEKTIKDVEELMEVLCKK